MTHRRFTVARLAVLAAFASVALVGGAALGATNHGSASAGPEWLPFKGKYSNAVGCTWNNGCNSPTPGYHGYPAIDFMVRSGTPVYAAGPGVVEIAHRCSAPGCGPNKSGFGSSIAIRHDNGRFSWYAHLSEVYPAEQSRVATGQLIGKSGSTGVATGPHLHYEERTTLWGAATLLGSMFAYHGEKKVSYPEVLGKSTWDALRCGMQRGEPGCTARHTVRNDGYSLVEATGSAPLVDIEIAIDTTSSMVPAIARAKADAHSLISGVATRYPGVRFAIAQFRDHTDSLEYLVEQAFTADPSLALYAVDRLNVAEGRDAPEAYNLVFNRVLDPRLGWRKGSRRLLVVIGDAEPHGAGTAGISGCHDSSADPRGYNTATELAKLRKARVTLLMVLQSSSKSTASIECYRSLAAAAYSGGGAFEGGSGSDVAAAINRLIDNAIRETPPFKYVALGDSYSSGEGVDPYFRENVDPKTKKGSLDNRCHRSSRAYAAWVQPRGYDAPLYRIASGGGSPGSFGGANKYGSDENVRNAGGVSWVFWACSGARIPNVRSGGTPQNSVKDGYREAFTQLDNRSVRGADLVTITIGGNDAGFADYLEQCAFMTSCQSLERNIELSIDAATSKLAKLYREIRVKTEARRILVLGYPTPFAVDSGQCIEGTAFTLGERDMIRRLGNRLNWGIRDAAEDAKVEFVPVAKYFVGHEVCGKKEQWINGIRGAIPVRRGPVDPESFHPNEKGQRLGYAAAINDVLQRGGP